MPSDRAIGSDSNGCAYGSDFLKLARELEIPEYRLETALEGATRLLRQSPPRVRPANKKALDGIAKTLEATVERLSDEAVRGRLIGAVLEEPKGSDERGDAAYIAWFAAQDRVDRALEGAHDLLCIVRAAEEVKYTAGRPQYDHWTVAVRSLLFFWVHDLNREATISGHASDPRGVKPSDTVRFVHRSMRLIGQDISEQACRTILRNLRMENPDCPGSLL